MKPLLTHPLLQVLADRRKAPHLMRSWGASTIILAGIVVNNAIVLVPFINQLHQRGMELTEAVVEAGRTRMRPIFMTALTTILALLPLLPLALGFGQGTEMQAPMAAAVIGGLLSSTGLTLVVVPVAYHLLAGKRQMDAAG